MAYYSLISSTPTSEDWIPSYVENVGPMVAKHGGTYLARSMNFERLEGTGENPAAWILIEWPSRESGHAFMNDPDYQPFLKARLAGSISHHFLLEGADQLSG